MKTVNPPPAAPLPDTASIGALTGAWKDGV